MTRAEVILGFAGGKPDSKESPTEVMATNLSKAFLLQLSWELRH